MANTSLSALFPPHPTEVGLAVAGPTFPAFFVRRLSRFSALVLLEGQEVLVHVPNSGRMRELLPPGRPCLVMGQTGIARKTAYDLVMVESGERWVGVDARLPSLLMTAALTRGALLPFRSYGSFRREAPYGRSRLDFLLYGDGPSCPLELKNVNRVVAGRAVFPDAPTTRGVRHLHELMAARQAGCPAAVAFIIQRDDAESLGPDWENDPLFSRTLGEAAMAGVALYAWRCKVTPQAILFDCAVPVALD